MSRILVKENRIAEAESGFLRFRLCHGQGSVIRCVVIESFSHRIRCKGAAVLPEHENAGGLAMHDRLA